jgi:hypothetical protein
LECLTKPGLAIGDIHQLELRPHQILGCRQNSEKGKLGVTLDHVVSIALINQQIVDRASLSPPLPGCTDPAGGIAL